MFEHCEYANDELMAFFRLLCDVPLSTMSGENETPFNASFRVVFHCSSPLSLPCAAIRFDALASCHPTGNPDLSVFSGSTAHSRPFSHEPGVLPRQPSLTRNPSGLTSRESGVFSGNSSVCSHDSKSIGAKRDSLRMTPSIRGSMVSSAEQCAMNVVQAWSMDGLFQLAVQRSEKKECDPSRPSRECSSRNIRCRSILPSCSVLSLSPRKPSRRCWRLPRSPHPSLPSR